MSIPNELVITINRQITKERTNQALYYAMGSILDARNLVHAAAFMKKQSEGEWDHAKKLADYLADRDQPAVFDTIPQAFVDPSTACAQMFAIALNAEQTTTASITELYRLAETMEPMTANFLLWFLTEQVEEEKVVSEILQQFSYYPLGQAEGFVNDYIRENMERFFGNG